MAGDAGRIIGMHPRLAAAAAVATTSLVLLHNLHLCVAYICRNYVD